VEVAVIVNTANVKDPKLSHMIRLASHYYASKLFHKNLSNNLEVSIELADNMDVDGLSTWEDDYIRPREFSVVIRRDYGSDRKQDYERILLTLAHEFVHIKQMAKGELKERFGRNEKCVLWKNTKFKSVFESESYWDLPWEIEAHGKEDGLLYRFVKHYNLFNELGYDNE
jgi:hypothetical protein